MAEPEAPAGARDLDELRAAVDALDGELVALLNRRAALIVEIGRTKRATGVPIYAPHREADVLRRVLGHNRGPLPARTIEAVYRELMSGSFALERPLRIGFLGPPGSFSHLAAKSHFGSSVDFEPLWAIDLVFTAVERGQIDYGLVPIENSTGGGIVETLDAFQSAPPGVRIYAELQLAVRHHVISPRPLAEIRKVYSNPEVLTQCKAWLRSHLAFAELVPVSSSSRGVELVKSETRERPDAPVAAIGSRLAAELSELPLVVEDIEDNPNNVTRFFVIAKDLALPSGDDKTSLMFRTSDEPGALVRVLAAFERLGINLTHIDKRPSGRENWTYTFWVDAQVHQREPRFQTLLDDIRGHCRDVVVLGSYPRSTRIL